MKRIVRMGLTVGAAAALIAAATALGGASTADVVVVDSAFEPQTVTNVPLQGSPEVRWSEAATNLPHSVHATSNLFDSGDPTPDFGTYAEDISAGKYPYVCEFHGPVMSGTVKVRPLAEPGTGSSARIIWADPNAEADHRFEVQFRREGARRWRTWKAATAAISGNFGRRDNPIDANPKLTYQLRAQTFIPGAASRRSGWSPVLEFSVADDL